MAVGARDYLIAFNVNLATGDLAIAREIAARVRQSGGGLDHVQAMGVFLESRNVAQVSMNLTNYRVTSIRTAYEAVKREAAKRGVGVLESELIGCLPGRPWRTGRRKSSTSADSAGNGSLKVIFEHPCPNPRVKMKRLRSEKRHR